MQRDIRANNRIESVRNIERTKESDVRLLQRQNGQASEDTCSVH